MSRAPEKQISFLESAQNFGLKAIFVFLYYDRICIITGLHSICANGRTENNVFIYKDMFHNRIHVTQVVV